jgi:hypothetical protein
LIHSKDTDMASKNLHRTSVELCRIVTKAEVIHRKRQVLALQSFRQDEKCAIHEIAGSATVLSLAVHGRKLNHTYGFGMFGPVTTEDLRSIEDTYKAWDAKASFRPGLEIDEGWHDH